MDVNDWVLFKLLDLRKSEQHRLVELMNNLPTDAVSNNHEAVDSYADEAIQLAKELKEPWVEIYLRHWRLQSKVLIRQQPKEMIREAVELLEFSHQPEHIDCPQSVCVVQDLAACYGAVDGPGYFNERQEVCEETLKRITPDLGCFQCVSIEYVWALYDNGDYEQVIERLDKTDEQLELTGKRKLSCQLELVRALVQIRLTEYDSALRILDKIKLDDEETIHRLEAKLYSALAYASNSNYEKAQEIMPTYDTISQLGKIHAVWVEVVALCAAQDKATVDQSQLQYCMQILMLAEERGAYRQVLTIGAIVAQLFYAVNDISSVTEAIQTMKRAQPLLRSDFGAAKKIEDVSSKLMPH